jgi:hypothetical protein
MINLPTNALRRCRRTGRSQHQALDEVKREICTRRRINDQGQHARIENNEEDPRETKEREGFGVASPAPSRSSLHSARIQSAAFSPGADSALR